MAGNRFSFDADLGDEEWFVYDAMPEFVASFMLPGVLSGGSGGLFSHVYLVENW